jgi:hypothetical protein
MGIAMRLEIKADRKWLATGAEQTGPQILRNMQQL